MARWLHRVARVSRSVRLQLAVASTQRAAARVYHREHHHVTVCVASDSRGVQIILIVPNFHIGNDGPMAVKQVVSVVLEMYASD